MQHNLEQRDFRAGAVSNRYASEAANGNRLSAKGKKWKLPEAVQVSSELLEIVDQFHLLAELLHRRGITNASSGIAFLKAESYQPTDPTQLPDVDKAIARITQAIAQKEKITIYGDYDVDGITATCVMLTVLRKLGAQVDFYIPNRAQEGYGLNLKAVSILASKQRTKLIITCDCGVSNFTEINFAKSLAVDTLILDHHSLPELLPPAVGIIHPKLLPETHPLYHLPGVGVAYKVCEALLIDQFGASAQPEIEALQDFVTLGMIADLVPLISENRYLVQIGLPRLISSQRPGIRALLAQVGKSQDTDLVGFGLAPRINAVGRLSDAKAAVELLTTDDHQIADKLAKQLQVENIKRQEICEQIFFEADQMVQTKLGVRDQKAIAIYKEGWHHGVVGIVASRLVEKYHRPVFIGELITEEGIVKGSARGVEQLDLYQVLKANEQLLLKWGGHKMAAGFSVSSEKAETFCAALAETCERMLGQNSLVPQIEIDAQVKASILDLPLVGKINQLAPFGMANKKPLFLMTEQVCQSVRVIGKEAKHNRVMIGSPETGDVFECVMWNSAGIAPPEGAQIDLVFTPEINFFNGRERLQLLLTDWRLSQSADQLKQDMTANSEFEAAPGNGNQIPDRVKEQVLETPKEEVVVADFVPQPKPLAQQLIWHDLRRQSQNHETILAELLQKHGSALTVFAEAIVRPKEITCFNRTDLMPTPQLLIWEFPPSIKIFQEILLRAGNSEVHLLGGHPPIDDDASKFLKQLLGLVRFAVSKKDGQVAGERLASALATTKMAVALGLSILRKVHVIDWYTEEGIIFLDLTGAPQAAMEDFAEYRQLADVLRQIASFRKWCATASLAEIQLATTSTISVGAAKMPALPGVLKT